MKVSFLRDRYMERNSKYKDNTFVLSLQTSFMLIISFVSMKYFFSQRKQLFYEIHSMEHVLLDPTEFNLFQRI